MADRRAEDTEVVRSHPDPTGAGDGVGGEKTKATLQAPPSNNRPGDRRRRRTSEGPRRHQTAVIGPRRRAWRSMEDRPNRRDRSGWHRHLTAAIGQRPASAARSDDFAIDPGGTMRCAFL